MKLLTAIILILTSCTKDIEKMPGKEEEKIPGVGYLDGKITAGHVCDDLGCGFKGKQYFSSLFNAVGSGARFTFSDLINIPIKDNHFASFQGEWWVADHCGCEVYVHRDTSNTEKTVYGQFRDSVIFKSNQNK